MLFKVANSEFNLTESNLVQPERALSSPQITDRFKKLAFEIKKVAPRSDDFLYFIARGIHAMEHAAIDPVSRQYNPKIGHIAYDDGHGQCKTCQVALTKAANRQPISGLWCSASQSDPWINQNGDAFPEAELLAEITDPKDSSRKIKAYQTFIGKGLFTDHKSSEVENIRGIILDAEYDQASKGVDLLIALDRINYPELARQISAGYSTNVSMGTQVNYSLCSTCGNKAVTEHDYCTHVASGKGIARAGQARCYEVNNGLNFIELSMVGNGADPRARIRTIVAQANDIKKNLEANLQASTPESENRLILDSINRLEQQVGDLQTQIDGPSTEPVSQENSFTTEILAKVASLEEQIKAIGGRFMTQKSQEKKAYMQGTVEPDVGKQFEMADKNYKAYWEQDIAQTGADQTNGSDGTHGGYGLGSDEEVKKMYLRASAEDRKKIRKALLEKAAYMQGTVEPDLTKPFEMADKNYKQYWEDDVKQSGEDQTNGPDGLHGGYGMGSDEQVKKDLLRAKLRAKLVKSANPAKNKWTVYAGDQEVLAVSADEAYGTDLNVLASDSEQSNQTWFDSRNYGINLIQAIKTLGLEKVASQIQKAKRVTAQAAPAPAAPAADAPAPEGEDATAPEATEMEAVEGIKAAADRVESAKDEILSLVETLEGTQKEEGEDLAGDLGAAGQELGELGGEMGAPMPPAQAKALHKLTRYALNHAEAVLAEAENFVAKFASDECEVCEKLEHACTCDEEDDKEDEEDMEKEASSRFAKKKLPEALRKMMEKKKKMKGDKKDKKAFTASELQTRKAARHAFAQQLYNLTEGDMVAEAHPEGGNKTTFPGQDDGLFETVTEQQAADEQVANSTPRGELVARRNNRARMIQAAEKIADAAQVASAAKAAEDAQKAADAKKKDLAKATQTQSPASTTASVKKAEADKEAKQYYKEEASQSATGTKPDAEVAKFYNELTQDFAGKKSTAAVHDFGLKMKRAYSVALKRANLGQIEATQDSIDSDVDRLMNLDDDSFVAFAEVVENTKKVKAMVTAPAKQVRTAGALNIGINQPEVTMSDALNKLPWK